MGDGRIGEEAVRKRVRRGNRMVPEPRKQFVFVFVCVLGGFLTKSNLHLYFTKNKINGLWYINFMCETHALVYSVR